jgi:uncharacterized membrane protein YkvA (DUF1232 family)
MNANSTKPGATTGAHNANTILRDVGRIWQLLRDPAVPGWKWLLPIGAVAYWFWPIDLIPFLPFDDIAVVVVAISMMLQMAARYSQTTPNAHPGQASAAGNPRDKEIDTTWRVVDKS